LSDGGQASGFLAELSWQDFFLVFFDGHFDGESFLAFFFLPALAAALPVPEAAGTAAADRLYR
jgi:hypothetical protein